MENKKVSLETVKKDYPVGSNVEYQGTFCGRFEVRKGTVVGYDPDPFGWVWIIMEGGGQETRFIAASQDGWIPVDPDNLKGLEYWGGLDLANTND